MITSHIRTEKAGAGNPKPAVIIIGAGITGINAAYFLRANNIPYTILERRDDVGGIWNTLRWHGTRCDSDFIKYSFSFKPFLSAQCLQGGERIHQYMRCVAEEFSILENIRFNTCVSKAVFDLQEKQWMVHTDQGIFTARFLINGNGYFEDKPYVPVFKDSAKFRGEIVHTSALDRKRTFRDKNVVLVGSGSTAICCAPELSLVSKSLVLLQRSPSYIYEISNKTGPFTNLCQSLYGFGITFPVQALRYCLQLRDDLIFVGFRRFPRIARWFFKQHWLSTVGKESFQKHFNPRYNPWEQRVPVAIGLKEKLRKQQISIKTGEVERFTESSIVLTDGENIECDTCVLATGLDLKFFNFDIYVGNAKVAVERINFYKGVMMGGVPNYFHPVGVWHSAWTHRSETAIRFALKIMAYMIKHDFRTVSIDRMVVDCVPTITPNYIKRRFAKLPRLYGTYELPSIDSILSFRFNPRNFNFL